MLARMLAILMLALHAMPLVCCVAAGGGAPGSVDASAVESCCSAEARGCEAPTEDEGERARGERRCPVCDTVCCSGRTLLVEQRPVRERLSGGFGELFVAGGSYPDVSVADVGLAWAEARAGPVHWPGERRAMLGVWVI